MTTALDQAKLKMSLLIKTQTSPEKYHRGFKLYQDRKITTIEQKGHTFYAKAKGTKTYTLWIDLDRYYGECSCPSDDKMEKCKHVAALAFALVDQDYQKPSLTIVKNSATKVHEATEQKPKKPAKKKTAKPRSPYPKVIADFLSSAPQEAQIALLHQLLQASPAIHSLCSSLIQSRTLDLKKMSALFKKHTKVFATDYFGQKVRQSLKELTAFFTQLQNTFTNDAQGYENRLIVASRLSDEILSNWGYDALFNAYANLVDPVIDAFEANPRDYLPILENGITNDGTYHPLWRHLVEISASNRARYPQLRALILRYIEESNVKQSAILETSEQLQRYTLSLIIEYQLEADDYFFSVIQECDYVKDKDHYYRQYYKKHQNSMEYLRYVDSLNDTKVDPYEIECLIEQEEWARLNKILDRFITDAKYVMESRGHLTILKAFSLKADLIRRIERDPTKQSLQLTELYQLLKNSTIVLEKSRAEFFWRERQYMEMLPYFKWFRAQSLISNNYGFKSTDVKNELIFYLKHFVQLDDPIIESFFHALLEIEKAYLKESKGNVYEFTYEVVAYAYACEIREGVVAFINDCQKMFPTRKKLNETLRDFARAKGLIL